MQLVVAHRILAIRDRAVKGLLPALKISFQLVLEPLWGGLLVIAESFRVQDSQGFSGDTLVCASMVVFIVKS